MELDILKASTAVSAGGKTYTVRELAWPDALEFLGALSKVAAAFVDPSGRLVVTTDKLAEVIASTAALSQSLITKSARISAEELSQLSFSDGLTLLDAALAANLSEIVIKNAAKVGSRLKAAFGQAQAQTLTPK